MSESLRLVKKYPNRRLYDTKTSAYITLSDVKGLVLSLENFKVVDAKSGEDLTRSILLQIIIEEETAGVPLFTTELLAQMIRFYGHAMEGMLGKYLETNIKAFTEFQKKLQEHSHSLYGENNSQMQSASRNFFGDMDAANCVPTSTPGIPPINNLNRIAVGSPVIPT